MLGNYTSKDVHWEKGYKDYPTAYLKLKTPSISTIISEMIDDPEFEAWKLSVGDDAERILKFCADRGTSMHLFCENFFKEFSSTKDKIKSLEHALETTPITLSNDNIPDSSIIKGRDLFYKIYNSDISNKICDVKGTELKIYSPKLFVRGALDILYVINGNELCVSDFKNASKPIESGTIKEYKYKVQLGGYAQMISDNSKGKLDVRHSSIICANTKENNVQEILICGDELEHYKNEFTQLAIAWHEKHNQSLLLSM